MVRSRKQFELTNAHLLDHFNNIGGTLGPGSDVGVSVGSDVVNIAPVANAGSNYTLSLPVSVVNLNGSLSNDPDGTIVSYKWKQLNGPNTANIERSTEPITAASNLIAGTYTFELSVTDNIGAVGKAEVIITVNPAVAPTGPAPIFNALPASLTPIITPAGTLIPGITPSIIQNPTGGTIISGGGSGGYGGGGGFGSGGPAPEDSTTTTTTTTKTESSDKLFGLVNKKVALYGGLGLLGLIAIWKRKNIAHLIKGN